MSAAIVSNLDLLRRRVRRFLHVREDVSDFVHQIAHAGEVAIFGGMLRDFAIGGSLQFLSDVDLVVQGDEDELMRALGAFSYSRNRFGGYRIRHKKQLFDVWCLSATWASREGHVDVAAFSDLPKTTFFDWDAIAYNVRTSEFHCVDDYVGRLHSGVVGINLSANPNELGVVVRALRMAVTRDLAFHPELATYVATRLSSYSPDSLCDFERKSFSRPALSMAMISDVQRQLHSHRAQGTARCFRVNREQMELKY